MNLSMFKAWSIGATMLIVVSSIWFVFLQVTVFSQPAFFLLWISPMVAAFVTSYISPSHKILLGASMALPFALLAVTLNSFDQFLGAAVDFPGLKGGFILFILVLISAAIVSIPSSVTAYALTKKDRQITS